MIQKTKNIKLLSIKNWSLIRTLQLLFGLFCLGDFFFYSGQMPVLAFGLVVLAQAVFNWQLGCATGRCQLPGK